MHPCYGMFRKEVEVVDSIFIIGARYGELIRHYHLFGPHKIAIHPSQQQGIEFGRNAMKTNNRALSLSKPKSNLGFLVKADTQDVSLDPDSSALNLLTDFHLTPAISVLASTQIDSALTRMICSGVRLLFVVDAGFKILGNITSYDIQGEKPLRYLQSRDCRIGICSREDILVQDIMTPVHNWKVINYDQLIHSTVANIALTFKELGQKHLIVVDTVKGRNGQVVRGLISMATLERALGTNIESPKIAHSFAEIETALAT
jgi:hypothetical protein